MYNDDNKNERNKKIIELYENYGRLWTGSFRVTFQHITDDLAAEVMLVITEEVNKTPIQELNGPKLIRRLRRITRWRLLRYVNYTARGAVSVKQDRTARVLQRSGTYIALLTQQLHREPTTAEIADYFGISKEAYEAYLAAIDSPWECTEDDSVTTDDAIIAAIDARDRVHKIFEKVKVTNRQAEVIRRRFYEDRDYHEIAEEEGGSTNRKTVRQRFVTVAERVKVLWDEVPAV
jgi:predicted DNA-binding protein YlxM (UPF0122 family)